MFSLKRIAGLFAAIAATLVITAGTAAASWQPSSWVWTYSDTVTFAGMCKYNPGNLHLVCEGDQTTGAPITAHWGSHDAQCNYSISPATPGRSASAHAVCKPQ